MTTKLDELIFTPTTGLLDVIRTAISAGHSIDEQLISLTFDGNKPFSIQYRLEATTHEFGDRLGLPILDVSLINLSIAKRLGSVNSSAAGEAARQTATREIQAIANTAVDTVVNFRRTYVSQRRSILRILEEIEFTPSIVSQFDWGSPEEGAPIIYRFCTLSFQLPHCHS